MNAVTVKFKKGEPEYLAVKKSLHPDLSVLYVYDANGKLVYQKTQVIEGLLSPTLAAVPAGSPVLRNCSLVNPRLTSKLRLWSIP